MDYYKTTSDRGSLLVGTKDFKVCLPNGKGDGSTDVTIIEKGDESMIITLDFYTVIEGKFNIYSYDCSKDESDIIATLEGKYGVYCGRGSVILKWWG